MTEKKRRAKGAGSLRHLGADKWRIEVKVNGKRHSRVFTTKNGTEAERAAAGVCVALTEQAARLRTSAGVERDTRRAWTVERYCDYYFAEWGDHHLAPTTRQRYRLIAKNQLGHIRKKKLDEVTPSDLTKLYLWLQKPEARVYKREGQAGLSPLSVWHVHTFLGAVYTFANRQEDTDRNPTRKVRPNVPRQPQKRPAALDHVEVEHLLSAIRDHRPDLYLPVMVSARLGTRRGELCGLRWCDVDFANKEVTIRRAVTRTEPEGLLVKSTKTGKERTIPLDADTIAELASARAEQAALRLKMGEGWRGADSAADDYICPGSEGAVLNPDVFEQRFAKHISEHGPEGVTLHVLRHAFVSQLIALGIDAVTISSMSGHSPDVLLKTYAHAFDTRKRDAMEALAEARKRARTA